MAENKKERPIPFNAPMVRALLDGSKSQTRRIVKPDPGPYWNPVVGLYNPVVIKNGGYEAPGPEIFGASDENQGYKCPYGQPGERLWAREAWRMLDTFDKDSGSRVAERCLDAGYSSPWAPIHYEADSYRRDWQHVGTPQYDGPPTAGRLRHARFMPRWASRILLEIVSVRVERLNDCSATDAWAEGIAYSPDVNPVHEYEELWESINGAGSWAANPFCWVVEFKRVTS